MSEHPHIAAMRTRATSFEEATEELGGVFGELGA